MRTSHLTLRKRIDNEKLKITDEELFASKAFAAYLTDMAEAASKRYKRSIKVRTYWDNSEHAEVACTDNRCIRINAGNFLTQSFPSRRLRADSLVGLNGHEIGHVLFTDFAALQMYMMTILSGRMYPAEPTELSTQEELNLLEIKEAYSDEDETAIKVIAMAASNISNVLEDVYIEARMCDAFPGIFRTGILLNNLRFPELVPSVTKQIDRGDHEFSIVVNLLIQYCKCGDINNLGNYKGEYLDALYDCVPHIDDAVYDDDVRTRYMSTNHIIVRLWKYIKSMVEKVKEDQKNGGSSLDELLDKLLSDLDNQIASGGSDPSGNGKGVPFKGKFKHNKDAEEEVKDSIQQVLDYETGRIALEKTDGFDEGDSGGVTYNNDFAGSGYTSAEEDMNRVLNQVVEEKVDRLMEEELTEELQAEANKINYGNAHRGVPVTVNRMCMVEQSMMESYKRVAPPLLLLSRRMQKQVAQVLKDKKEGGKQTGLLMGKRLNARSLVHDDGRVFYKNRLPLDDIQLTVGLLVDESGSMGSNDRITVARAASITIYDFCRKLGIPVIVYGHTSYAKDLNMFAYAEFDSMDRKDMFRLMDMSSRSGNRDGAALRFVAERLMTRNEEVKLLILISDGQPASLDYYGTEAEADLRGIKREYTNKGITLFAAAIGDDKPNIERIYGDGFLDITDLHKLPSNLTSLIARHIKV